MDLTGRIWVLRCGVDQHSGPNDDNDTAAAGHDNAGNDKIAAPEPCVRGGLRLAWSHPRGSRLVRPAHLRRRGVAATRWRVNLAVAIELQLEGQYGLSEDDFLSTFSGPPEV